MSLVQMALIEIQELFCDEEYPHRRVEMRSFVSGRQVSYFFFFILSIQPKSELS